MFNELLKNVMKLGIITDDDVKRLTAIELMMLIIERTNGLLNHVEIIDEKIVNLLENIRTTTIEELDKWKQNGTFDVLINQSALTKINERVDETNAQLSKDKNELNNRIDDVLEHITGGNAQQNHSHVNKTLLDKMEYVDDKLIYDNKEVILNDGIELSELAHTTKYDDVINVIDNYALIDGKKMVDGVVTKDAHYYITEYIPVNSGDVVKRKSLGTSSYTNIYLFDINKKFVKTVNGISQGESVGYYTFTIEPSIRYIVVELFINKVDDEVITISKNNHLLSSRAIENGLVDGKDIFKNYEEVTVDCSFNYLSLSEKWRIGKKLNFRTGFVDKDGDKLTKISDFIPIHPSSRGKKMSRYYSHSEGWYSSLFFYDDGLNYIGYADINSMSDESTNKGLSCTINRSIHTIDVIIPNNASYFRVTSYNVHVNTDEVTISPNSVIAKESIKFSNKYKVASDEKIKEAKSPLQNYYYDEVVVDHPKGSYKVVGDISFADDREGITGKIWAFYFHGDDGCVRQEVPYVGAPFEEWGERTVVNTIGYARSNNLSYFDGAWHIGAINHVYKFAYGLNEEPILVAESGVVNFNGDTSFVANTTIDKDFETSLVNIWYSTYDGTTSGIRRIRCSNLGDPSTYIRDTGFFLKPQDIDPSLNWVRIYYTFKVDGHIYGVAGCGRKWGGPETPDYDNGAEVWMCELNSVGEKPTNWKRVIGVPYFTDKPRGSNLINNAYAPSFLKNDEGDWILYVNTGFYSEERVVQLKPKSGDYWKLPNFEETLTRDGIILKDKDLFLSRGKFRVSVSGNLVSNEDSAKPHIVKIELINKNTGYVIDDCYIQNGNFANENKQFNTEFIVDSNFNDVLNFKFSYESMNDLDIALKNLSFSITEL